MKELIQEALSKHRELKNEIINLMEQSNRPNMTKDKMREELFRIYLLLK